MEKECCLQPGRILLPGEQTPLEQWACLACDQFTSQPEYWEKARAVAAGTPSMLDLILPECELDKPDTARRVEKIHAAMQRYQKSVLTRAVDGFVYVERTLQDGQVRQGLLGCVDLEQYSYEKGSQPPVRPSENTVVERIPPRLAVRRGAVLESPHILMLADDPTCTLIEPVAAQKAKLPLLYDGELMLGGGHIRGWAVEDAALCADIANAVQTLGSQAAFDARCPEAAGQPPIALAVGDGNHSLATAKAYWEELKPGLTAAERESHPARFCLAEVCNLHSPAIEIEPIHRVLFGARLDTVLLALTEYADSEKLGIKAGEVCEGFAQQFRLLAPGEKTALPLGFATPRQPLTVGSVEDFVQRFLAAHTEARVDYIHGEDACSALVAQGGIALLLPELQRAELFRGIALGAVLPRKTFSMGHAEEKRYYLECRALDATPAETL